MFLVDFVCLLLMLIVLAVVVVASIVVAVAYEKLFTCLFRFAL